MCLLTATNSKHVSICVCYVRRDVWISAILSLLILAANLTLKYIIHVSIRLRSPQNFHFHPSPPRLTFYILRVEGNCSLCFLARRGETFSSGTGLGTSLPRSRFLDVTQRSPIQAAQTARRQSYMHTLFNVPMRGA